MQREREEKSDCTSSIETVKWIQSEGVDLSWLQSEIQSALEIESNIFILKQFFFY